MKPDDTIVIGLGNEFRGDDAAGLAAVEAIRQHNLPGVTVVAGVSDGMSLLMHWEKADRAYVVDCTVSGTAPGTVCRFEIGRDVIPEQLFSTYSTHAFNVTEAVELARLLGRLPARLVVYGIEGICFRAGATLTEVVSAGAREVAAHIVADLALSGRPSARITP